MRISRLYVPVPLETDQILHLNEESAHYIRSVLRLKNNTEITLFNGDGGEFEAQITSITRRSAIVEVGSFRNRNIDPPLNINLGLSISRGERMDFALQKCVELGVSCVFPLIAERCVVRLHENRKAENRQQHWQKIAQNASEQCGRTSVPEIASISKLEDWVEKTGGLKIFLDPYGQTTLDQLEPPTDTITLLSGPEGGFSENERQFAVASGFNPISLGQRILRTETACIAAMAAILMLWGDFRSYQLAPS
ncbi:MAG: 16S rRNA (uracil(1498)-N(3))-methyltransferase [Methylococcales bacterium]